MKAFITHTLALLLLSTAFYGTARADRNKSPALKQKESIAPPHFAGKSSQSMLNAHPPGPVLTESTIDDPDIKTLADLVRLYPVPKTFQYAMTSWGQPILKRIKDGARFSITVYKWKNKSGMLTIDIKRKDKKRWAYDTTEVIRRDLEPDCVKKWGYPNAAGTICITGFARGGVPKPGK